MVQYIYFVKHPGCEDNEELNHFDTFETAKKYALSHITAKPVITQVEANYNDFNECIESKDFGVIWSWEDEMSDIDREPDTGVIFFKSDLADNETDTEIEDDSENDSEDDEIDTETEDNPEEDEIDIEMEGDEPETKKTEASKTAKEIGANYNYINDCDIFADPDMAESTTTDDDTDIKEPIKISFKSGKDSLSDALVVALVEELEKSEDQVECKKCYNLVDKGECQYKNGIGYVCSECLSTSDTINKLKEDLDRELTEAATYVYPNIMQVENVHDKILETALDNLDEKTRSIVLFKPKNMIGQFPFRLDYTQKDAPETEDQYTSIEILDFKLVNNEIFVQVLVTTESYWSNKKTVEAEKRPLEEMIQGTPRTSTAYRFLCALREAATELEKENRPTVQARRNTNTQQALEERPEVVEELKNHIVRIEYRIPLLDNPDNDFFTDKNKEELTPAAHNKLERIYDDFCANEFADAAIDAGMVKNRASVEDTNHNIENSWAPMGTLTFDCPINQLSPEAIELIQVAKAKRNNPEDYLDMNGRVIHCYRLANMLIKYFNNDVKFYEKPSDPEEFKEPALTGVAEGCAHKNLVESTENDNKIELEYTDLPITIQGPMRDVDDWDEVEDLADYTLLVDRNDIIETLVEECMTDEDVAEIGGFDNLDEVGDSFFDKHLDELIEKYKDDLLDAYEDEAIKKAEESASWEDYKSDLASYLDDQRYDERRDDF